MCIQEHQAQNYRPDMCVCALAYSGYFTRNTPAYISTTKPSITTACVVCYFTLHVLKHANSTRVYFWDKYFNWLPCRLRHALKSIVTLLFVLLFSWLNYHELRQVLRWRLLFRNIRFVFRHLKNIHGSSFITANQLNHRISNLISFPGVTNATAIGLWASILHALDHVVYETVSVYNKAKQMIIIIIDVYPVPHLQLITEWYSTPSPYPAPRFTCNSWANSLNESVYCSLNYSHLHRKKCSRKIFAKEEVDLEICKHFYCLVRKSSLKQLPWPF